jgi:hypothetical protein
VAVDALPGFLVEAVREVGETLGLDARWLNHGPAARWTRTHDPSVGFLNELVRILNLLGVVVTDGDL